MVSPDEPLDWTEKYRPRTLKEVVGNREAKKELLKWASKWTPGRPEKRAVILAGDAGIGKTSSALALANEMGWEALEMNASDDRNSEAIKDFIGRSAVDDTFSSSGDFIPYKDGSRKLLILDEADNIFGREDYGGLREMAYTIQSTEQPIVLIANDYYDLKRRSGRLARLCKKIDFEPVRESDIIRLLSRICNQEKISCEGKVLKAIARRSKGDVRSAVRDLESLATGRDKVKVEDLDALGTRNREAKIFPTLEVILQEKDPIQAKKSASELNEEPQNLLLWIDENLPREYKDLVTRAKGFDWLSRSDVYLGRVYTRQYYRFWSYANDLMTAGVNIAKKKPYSGWTRYAFPTWLRKMSQSKKMRSDRRKTSMKIARATHCTTNTVNSSILPYFKQLFRADRQFREKMTKELELERDEVAFLLDVNIDSQKVKALFEEDERYNLEEKKGKKREKDKDEGKKEKKDQKSLLEF
ncbi:MAG: replication factor C large subunit [Thermoplasmatota archaeon]